MGKKKKKKFTEENTPKEEVKIDIENDEEIHEEEFEDEEIREDEVTQDEDVVVEDEEYDVEVEEEVVEEDRNDVEVEEVVEDEEVVENNDGVSEEAEEEELVYEKPKREKSSKNKTGLMNTTLVILLLSSLVYLIMKLFYGSGDEAVLSLIGSFILLLFTSLFVCIGFSIGRRKKNLVILSSLLLIGYFAFTVWTECFIHGGDKVLNFTGMSLTDVINWSEEKKIELIQDYEYSDMISEYHVINQDVLAGTAVKDVDTITVAISEGPNPAKEVTVPSMLGWTSEDVLEFIKENYLSNVEVEFIESKDAQDTVIEQSKVGNLKRNEELKLVFSVGEEIDYEEVKLVDFSGMSEFEVIFYLKQHHLRYEIEEDFSSDVKKGYAIKQSIKAGTLVKINDEKVVITISKGPEIKIVDLKGMSTSEVTEWVIKNKLKVEFDDAYDDSVKENYVIRSNYSVGDVVEEGTVIKIVLSKGKLVMPMFESLNQFREWAATYSIEYEEKHEFSDNIDAGDVIKFSHEANDTIKNDDTVVVTISDGKKINVPSVVGLSKSEATSKLKSAGLGYNFVYSYSSSVEKGKAIKQSISVGSEVAKGTTVTVTLSNGPKPTSSSSNNSGSSSSSGNSTPACDTSKGATFWAGVGNTGAQVYNSTKSQNPGFTITPNYVDSCPNGATTSGMVCSMNVTEGSWVSYCTTIKMTIVK